MNELLVLTFALFGTIALVWGLTWWSEKELDRQLGEEKDEELNEPINDSDASGDVISVGSDGDRYELVTSWESVPAARDKTDKRKKRKLKRKVNKSKQSNKRALVKRVAKSVMKENEATLKRLAKKKKPGRK